MPELLTYEDFFYPMESPKPTPNLQIRLTLYNNHIQQTILATEFQELKDLISQNDFNCWLEIHGLQSSEDLKEISEFLDEYYDRYTGLYLKSKEFLKMLKKL